ncbi:MAG: hypothetical protein Q4C91_23120 [Eubacteriales bacterium]|nr:hypothetical protein [Eubacteriales bacterium]
MSNRERAIQLLNAVPDYKIGYVIAYLQGITAEEYELNDETIEAIKEADNMVENGTGQHFKGSTEDFFNTLLEG